MATRQLQEYSLCYYDSRFGVKAQQCRKEPGPGKCEGRRSVVAVGAGHDSKLLSITDTLSGCRLLVDSGDQHSILPAGPPDTLTDEHGPGWMPPMVRLYALTAPGV